MKWIGFAWMLVAIAWVTSATGAVETWESAPLQSPFDGNADCTWVGDIGAFAIEPGTWPDGIYDFGYSDTKAIRSSGTIDAAGLYTILTDVTDPIDPTQLIEWSVFVSGNSIAIQSGYWFQAVLLANTADTAAIASPGAAFAGYKLSVTNGDYLTLWKCAAGDGEWTALGQVDLGSAAVSHGWNLHVARTPAGEWTVSHARGAKGTTPEFNFTVADTSVDLSAGPWYAGMSWRTKATSHADKFGFDDFAVTASEPPNVPPVADAGGDRTVTDTDTDGTEIVTLDASASTDSDGTIVSYVWTEAGATLATTAIAPVELAVGIHPITLTVTDDDEATDADSITVTVMPGGPWPPVADAGDDQNVRDADGSGAETLTLDGSGSSDLGGTIVGYTWSEDGTTIATGETASAAFAVGVHTVTLEVLDDEGLTDTDTVEITVRGVGPTTEQLSQYGITWTFAEPVEYGQFVNGDWWVVGPVTIVAVDPAPADGRHGSMLDPAIGQGQAYDDRSNNYDPAVGVTFPVTLTGETSLVSSLSWTDGADTHDDLTGHPITLCKIRTAAVLTVLDDVPPADAFRPPYAGTDKPIFRQSDLRYDPLPRLAPPNADPDYDYEDVSIFTRDPSQTVAEQYGRLFQRVWLLHLTDANGRTHHPTENMPGYHASVYHAVQVGATLLLMDLPDIDNLLLGFVQVGIDSHGVIATGAGGTASDADSSIHKWPVLLAGLLLDDEAMQTNPYRYRTEWMSYYLADGLSSIESAVVPRGYTYNGYTVGWRQDPGLHEHEHLDPATEWHLVPDGGGGKRETYRGINSRTWPGIALAARRMGAAELWNHPAFFDYVDRWMTEEPTEYGTPAVGSCYCDFVKDVWNTYRWLGGDADDDGDVDLDDFVILKNNFGSPGGWAEGDFDGNGTVDLDDFAILKNNFGAEW
ncbi:MAG: PKD domain-containing protein [Planctomycetota bacterium]